MQSRSNSNYKGIDIANYQAGLDFALVKSAGIKIVYIKATEGLRYVNPYLKQHYQEAKAQGLYVGFYHFFKPDISAVGQAQHFCNSISGMSNDVLPMLDVEVHNGYSRGSMSSLAAECLAEIQRITGLKPVVYTYTSFARTNLSPEGISNYPLWIADYNNRGYPSSNPIWSGWIGYQYSSSGNIGGITVDLDEFTDEIFVNGGEPGMQKFEQQDPVKVTLFGVDRSDCVLIDVEGRPTTYIPAIALRESGHEVTWDRENEKVVIKEGGSQ